MREKEKKQTQVYAILEQLAQGRPNAEIILELEEKERAKRAGEISEQKGSISERRAKNAIAKLDVVISAHLTQKFSPEDRNLIDILVNLRNLPDLCTVKVQVKSSKRGIRQALDETKRIRNLTNDEDLNEWLLKNKYIFVNGNLSHDQIQAQFLQQLEPMAAFHAAKQSDKQVEASPQDILIPSVVAFAADAGIEFNKILDSYYHAPSSNVNKNEYIAEGSNKSFIKPLSINYRNILHEYVIVYKPDIIARYSYEKVLENNKCSIVCSLNVDGLDALEPVVLKAQAPTKNLAGKLVALLMLERLGILPAQDSPVKAELEKIYSTLKLNDYRRKIIELINSHNNQDLSTYNDIKQTLFPKCNDIMVDDWTKSAIYRTKVLLRDKGYDFLKSQREGVYWITSTNARTFQEVPR